MDFAQVVIGEPNPDSTVGAGAFMDMQAQGHLALIATEALVVE
jgi:hypothetical protein